MRAMSGRVITALAFFCSAALAQKWEIGGVAGGGFYQNLNVTNAGGSAVTGFQNGPVFGGLVGQNMYRYMSGELHYGFSAQNLKVSGAGAEATFKGMAHVIHYDFLVHTAPLGARVRPFVAGGGGMKIFQGTGNETAYQPLSQFALLTRTQELKPMITVGGGTKFQIAPRVYLRVEFRDQITPFPKNVIAPAPGASIKGWLHDFIPMAGITFTF
jgi:Outer membrane protein beta-barrel domain